MDDETLANAFLEIVDDIKRFHDMPDDAKERGGSPGEWMYERLDELETEMTRRFMGSPQESGQ